jgi:twitching motility protein PilT
MSDAYDDKMTKKLRFYLLKLTEYGGSDLHIKTGSNIRARINGEILSLSKEILNHNDGVALAKELLRERFAEFAKEKSIDFTFKLNDQYRFRVNLFFQIDGISGVFRTIPASIPTIESLHLPEVVHSFCHLPRGLLLVTGPTGSGKSTTLAAIINQINQTRKKHIITIEDPVEFVYKDNKSIINQRAIGQDAISFSHALRSALREDPDVILVGEMRDLETIETAMHAAETGHLVLSTLHTVDAKETVSRIIGMFPGSEQNRIKISLASVLQGVISQRLVKKAGGGRVAAMEILVKSARIESLIMEGRDSEIPDALAEGKDIYKTQTFDQSLFDLFKENIIDKQEAISNASYPSDLKMKIENFVSQKTDKTQDVNEDIISLKK